MTDAERKLIAKEKTAAETHYQNIHIYRVCGDPVISADEALKAFHAGAAWAREQQEVAPREYEAFAHKQVMDELAELRRGLNNQRLVIGDTTGSDLRRLRELYYLFTDHLKSIDAMLLGIDDKLSGKDAPQPADENGFYGKAHQISNATDESGQSAGFAATDTAGPTRSGITQEIYESYVATDGRRLIELVDEIERLTAQRDEYKSQVEGLIEVKRRLKSDLQGQRRETLRLQKQIDNAKAMWS